MLKWTNPWTQSLKSFPGTAMHFRWEEALTLKGQPAIQRERWELISRRIITSGLVGTVWICVGWKRVKTQKYSWKLYIFIIYCDFSLYTFGDNEISNKQLLYWFNVHIKDSWKDPRCACYFTFIQGSYLVLYITLRGLEIWLFLTC